MKLIFHQKGVFYIRTVKRFIEGLWKECDFIELRKGDLFRLFDDGVLYIDDEGNTDYCALGDPIKNEDGIWFVNVERAIE